MRIFAIADLHLSSADPKPMDVFGPEWKDHSDRIRLGWDHAVASEDMVMVAGDTSWAMRLPEAMPDLEYLAQRPGQKLIVRGNHDYWWKRQNTGRIQRAIDPSLTLLQGHALTFGSLGITGTRGWRTEDATCAGSPEADSRIMQRELQYLRRGLEALPEEVKTKIVILHYPPYSPELEPNEFMQLLQSYSVDITVYGHIHSGERLEGSVGALQCHLVAADYIGFAPKLILSV
jgi:uncharacterized protein